MPSRVTRSGREVRNSSTSQAKLDALELLERKRRGEKIDVGIKEDEPLFDEVEEEDYRRSHKGGFVVDAGSDEDEYLDDDFIDDNDYESDNQSSTRGSKRKRKEKSVEVDPKQRSMRSFLGGSKASKQTSASSSVGPSTSKQSEVNEDDILSQMLFQVPVNKSSPAQKPLRVASRHVTTKADTPTLKPSPSLDPIRVKRPRIATPPPEDNFCSGGVQDDCFDDSMPPFDSLPIEIDKPTVKEEKLVYSEGDIEDNSGIEVTALNDDIKSNLDFKEIDGSKQSTRFFWYDCCEDQVKYPGVVYFFGRIFTTTAKRYVSCCAVVKNIKRTCYLAISHDSSYEEATEEFSNITAKMHKIKNFSCEKVTKKYAFSESSDLPLESDYIKVEYPYTQPALPVDLKGQTFHKVLNVNQTPMEKLILELKLRGPCWLSLVDPVAPNSNLTWTRIELVVESPENLIVETAVGNTNQPYFCTFSLSLCTYPNPITHLNEIIAIAGMVNTTFNLDQCLKRTNKASGHFCIMTKPTANHRELKLPYDFTSAVKKYKRTRFELFDTERDLLMNFLEKFGQLDPDIVVGHDLLNFDYETLVMRMSKNKIGQWSKLGRFKRSELPSTKAAFRYMFSGRIMCDIRTSAMELIRARSYDLMELTHQVLQKNRTEFDHSAIVESFKSSQGLIKLLDATWEDNDNIFSILVELNIIPLALKITNITGNILSRTLAAGRSERNEYLLLHAFHEDNFICPEKQVHKFQKKAYKARDQDSGEDPHTKELGPVRKKAAYSGGLVLEPKTGYYDSCILLMDFNSLYPSIIQEFNICFSTVTRPEKCNSTDGEFIASVPDESIITGILPTQLKNLVERRRQVKRLLADSKSPEDKMMLDIEQKALKLTANSMYGCLGFEHSRFYAKHLASLVTFKGREILMNTKAMVEKLGYEVIYGDTDSLMIDTKVIDYDEVLLKGSAIKSEINRTFKLLEIDIDGVYRPLLLLKKKNYAGTTLKKLPDGTLVKSMETKGLDTVRRDRAVIAKEAGEKILSMILCGEKEIDDTVEDIHNYLKQLGEQIQNSQVPNEKFLISKQLNRNPEEYRDTKGLGHVALALRHNSDSKKTRKLKAGDTVEYVICLDNSADSANQRAYTLEEMARDELKLDNEYYLCQQIHPVITRICDKLPITNAYVLAEMLGIEKCSSLHIRREETETTKRDQLLSKGEARFHSCKPLVIKCFNCNSPNEVTTRTSKVKNKKFEMSLLHCPACGIRYGMKGDTVVVQLIAMIKQLTIDLYNTSFVCESSDCNHRTRNAFRPITTDEGSSLATTKAQPICDQCESPMVAEMDDRKMDLQLGYLKHLFDVERELQNTADLETPPEDTLQMYKNCLKEVNFALRCSFINNIDTYSMFSMVCSATE